MPFKKHMLLDYRLGDYQALNVDAFEWVLTVRVVSWWGLSDRIVQMRVNVPYHVSAEGFYKPKLNVWSTAP